MVLDRLEQIKNTRQEWISLFETKEPFAITKAYEQYLEKLFELENEEIYDINIVEEEINNAIYIYEKNMFELANKYFEKEDYYNALISFEYTSLDGKYKTVDIEKYMYCLHKYKREIPQHMIERLYEEEISLPETFKIIVFQCNKYKDYKNGIKYIEKAINVKKDYTADEYNLFGCIYNALFLEERQFRDLELAKKAFEYFDIAVGLNPKSKIILKNAIILAGSAGQPEKQKEYWDRYVANFEMSNNDKHDFASFSLRNGDFENYRKYFKARFKRESGPTKFPEISGIEWTGREDLSNSTLLVYYEQGFGDVLLVFGYMSRLKKLAKHVIFIVQSQLYNLLKVNDFGIEVLNQVKTKLDDVQYDYWVPAMEVPICLGVDKSNACVGEGFIKADEKIVEKYRKKHFKNKKIKIGISFSGNSTGDRTRDVPLETFLILDKLKNIEIYSFQMSVPENHYKIFKNHKVKDLSKTFRDFADTAGALKNLDVLIASDNGVMNLAGALGVKTFCLFNSNYNARWYDLSGEDVGYYTSVKPFVNDEFNNWDYSINKAIEQLKKDFPEVNKVKKENTRAKQ